MQGIRAVLIEPVGCLADFPAEPFLEIATRVFGRKKKSSQSGSRSYWHLLNLIEDAARDFNEAEQKLIEELEIQAVDAAHTYEDVTPALVELHGMGIDLVLTTSLSSAAASRFVSRNSLEKFFSATWNRNNAGGVKAKSVGSAARGAAAGQDQTIFLTDAWEGMKVARAVGVARVLMMNDPDEAMKLAMRNPAGGIVSLLELPDFIRLVASADVNDPADPVPDRNEVTAS